MYVYENVKMVNLRNDFLSLIKEYLVFNILSYLFVYLNAASLGVDISSWVQPKVKLPVSDMF